MSKIKISQNKGEQSFIAKKYREGWEIAQGQLKVVEPKIYNCRKTTARRWSGALILLLLLSTASYGQQLTQTIRGRILDQESQTPIIGASVVILGSNPLQGASTDINGDFIIPEVPIGRHTIRITSIGYEDNVIPEIEIISGKEKVLNVFLTESLTQLQEIVITGDEEKGEPINEMATVSARSFTVEETQRYAASANDPARMVLSFPGVASSDDGSNEIIVRGNSPRGVLWRVQGVEIPNPNHFGEEGASSGGITMLSAQMLSTSDFYTGAFPAEYGNGYSAAFDLFLRKGNNEKREYTAALGVMGIDFAAEGPFKEGYEGSYLVNYRYSTLGILEKISVLPYGNATPVFQDLSFNINLPTTKFGTFSLWGIGGLSHQRLENDDEEFLYKYNMGVSGLTHRFFMGDNTFVESTLSVTKSLNGFDWQETENNLDYIDDFENGTLRGSVMVNHKFNARHSIRAGAVASRKSYDLYQAFSDADTSAVEVDADGKTQLYQSYVQWKSRLSEKLTLNTGVHFLYLTLNNQNSIEPRMGLQYKPTPTRTFGIGYGIHSKMESLAIYMSRFENGTMPNKNLDFIKAHHFVLSYEESLKPGFRLKSEAYYQMLNDIPIAYSGAEKEWLAFSLLNYNGGLVNYPLVNEGSGKNYGIELSLEKSFDNSYYYMVTASLYESKYTGRDGVERDTRFNGNFTGNVLFGKEYYIGKGDNNVLGLNLRLLTAGGNRWTPVLREESIAEGEAVYDWDKAYTLREGIYFRTDLRFSYRRNKKHHSSIWSLDFQNATNHQNVFGRFYDDDEQEVITEFQTGLLPLLSYKIEF